MNRDIKLLLDKGDFKIEKSDRLVTGLGGKGKHIEYGEYYFITCKKRDIEFSKRLLTQYALIQERKKLEAQQQVVDKISSLYSNL